MQITHHTQLLNALIEKYSLRSYLEIGIQTTEQNFDKIRAEIKSGCDPEYAGNYDNVIKQTSDEWFRVFTTCWPDSKIDLIFIDGLHHADQVKRDFENSLRCLSDNGFIVIHDVLPENEAGTIVPRETKVWWGDVYKFAMNVREYKGLNIVTYNIDNGCMVVSKNADKEVWFDHDEYTWTDYLQIGRTLMNVTDEVTI